MTNDLSIPKFLIRTKDNELAHPGKLKGVKLPKEGEHKTEMSDEDWARNILASMSNRPVADFIAKEMGAGRVRAHFLRDPSTLALLEREWNDKEERRLAGIEKLRALGEAKRKERAEAPPKPTFGQHSVIKSVAPNKRKPGSGAHARYEEMAAYVKSHSGATVADVLEHTSYRQDDYKWDVERKFVVTDVRPSAEKKEPKLPLAPTQEKAMATGRGKASPTAKPAAKKSTAKKGKK